VSKVQITVISRVFHITMVSSVVIKVQITVISRVFHITMVSSVVIKYNYKCILVFYWMTICNLCWCFD